MILDHETVLIDGKADSFLLSKVFDFGATAWGGGVGNLDGDWEIVVTAHNDTTHAPQPFVSTNKVWVLLSDDESVLNALTKPEDVSSLMEGTDPCKKVISLPEGKSMLRIPSRSLQDFKGRYLKLGVNAPGVVTAAIVLESPRNNVTL